MRKLTIFALYIGISLLILPMMASAAAITLSDTTPGTTDTITDSASSAALVVGTSPKVSLSYEATNETYGLCGFNSAGTIEYGVYSGSSSVYQHSNTGTVTPADEAGAFVGSWPTMGGAAAEEEEKK